MPLGNFGNFLHPTLPVSFGGDTKSCWSVLSGVYASGSNVYTDSDQKECKGKCSSSSGEVKKQLDSLRRCQSLEEVQKLHEAGEHEKVVELLLTAEEKNKVRCRPLSVKLLPT